MSHIEDLWWKEEPDPENPRRKKREKKAGFGKGMRYKVRWIDPAGNEVSKSFPDGKKREAQAYQTHIDDSLLDRKYIDPKAGKKPFAAAYELWLQASSPNPRSRTTWKTQYDNHIEPFFGKMSTETASTKVIEWMDWLNQRKAYGHPLGEFYKVLLFRQVSGIFRVAVAAKWIPVNPCTADGVKRPRAPKSLVVPWTKDRLLKIEAALSDRARLVVPLGAGQGMRRGEILAFSPEDINRETNEIVVRRQIRRLTGGRVFSLPKGDKTRIVPAASWVIDRVDAYMEAFPPRPVTLPWGTLDGRMTTVELVMVRADEDPWYGELFQGTEWAGAFRRAQVVMRKRVDGVHALRHLYASLQLAAGVSVRELAEYLGHADPKTTLSVYTHLMPSSAPRSRLATDAYFDPARALTAQLRTEPVIEDDGTWFDADGEPVDLD
ncbi:tyrosine-type recombinase/integrase [Nocardia thailandica]|uniref:tyrosine-type recombinase/integrase n=1 Tax=Nocardia thailandica TaxID=257275 RepID=UPI0002DB2C29|nr:site-specific integrase [Nocardia thailandica]